MSYDEFLEKMVDYLKELFEDEYLNQYSFLGYCEKDGDKGITIKDENLEIERDMYFPEYYEEFKKGSFTIDVLASNAFIEFIKETI